MKVLSRSVLMSTLSSVEQHAIRKRCLIDTLMTMTTTSALRKHTQTDIKRRQDSRSPKTDDNREKNDNPPFASTENVPTTIKECKVPSSASSSSSNSWAISARRPRRPDASPARRRSTRNSGLESGGSLAVLRMRSRRCRRNHDQAGNGSRIALEFLLEEGVACWQAVPFQHLVAAAHYQGRSSALEMQAAAEIRVVVGRLVARVVELVSAIAWQERGRAERAVLFVDL